jgi:methylmalonyl-CoA/ethylmalonyl-CoA epimerase
MMNPPQAILPTGSRFHHVGVACRSLENAQADLRALGYERAGTQFVDPLQGVVGIFMEGTGPRLELLAPWDGSTVLDPWLRNGSRIYHLGYEVADIDSAIRAALNADARQVTSPVPAVAFDGRRIAFLMLRVPLMIELIELG